MLRRQVVLHTRAEDPADGFPARLRAAGAEPRALPCIELQPSPEPEALRAAALGLGPQDVLAAGSIAALAAVGAELEAAGRVFTGRIGCVGVKTAEALQSRPSLRARLSGPIVYPQVARAEALAERLIADPPAGEVLYSRAPEGRTVLIDQLRAAGVPVRAVLSYAIGCCPPQADDDARLEGVDVAVFLSGRTLECFVRRFGPDRARAWLAARRVAVIGPVALERAAQLGVRVDVCPSHATQEALIAALSADLRR